MSGDKMPSGTRGMTVGDGGTVRATWQQDGQQFELLIDLADERNRLAEGWFASEARVQSYGLGMSYRSSRPVSRLQVELVGHYVLNVRDMSPAARWARALCGQP